MSKKRHVPRVVRGTKTTRAPTSEKYQQLLKEYKKLAKRADQRLVRIEKYARDKPKYANIKQYAYARAIRDIRAWSGDKANRFNTKAPLSTQGLMAKIRDIEYFLHSASSTIKPTYRNGKLESAGIESVYGKRADTLNTKYGTNVSWENIGQLFESQLYRKMAAKYSSKTAVKIIASLQKNDEDILKALKDKKAFNVRISKDKPLEEKINKTLRYYKKDISSLYDSL